MRWVGGQYVVRCGGGLPFMFFMVLFSFVFKSARIALARFLLSTSPEQDSHNSKAFGKKIRSPTPAAIAASDKRMRGRFFLQNPQGPALMIWPSYQKFAVIKSRGRAYKRVLKSEAVKNQGCSRHACALRAKRLSE